MTILQTKIRIPHKGTSLVERPRLPARLASVFAHRLTALSAPPGFGKTTLLADWAQKTSQACWLSLDETDNEPIRFWSYLLAAIDSRRPGLTEPARGLLQAQPPAPGEAVVHALLNTLADSAADLVLILDDYHLIDNDSIHSALTFFVERLPLTVHLVLASRADPPLPLPHLRAHGQLLELRAADLRFTAEEAAVFLNQVMGLTLTADQVSALEARAEGWIAGLQLAALWMRGCEDVDGFIAAFTGSGHSLVDYLAGEIIARQSPEAQDFLLQTSILDRLCGSLCDAVVGQVANLSYSGQRMLETFEQANLFTIRLDDSRQWYRYHRLFADFLRNRLFHTRYEQLPGLHLRASEWLEHNGFADEAIRHAMSAQDWGRASRLVGEAAPQRMQRGEMRTMLNWLGSLPDPVVRSAASLCILHARVLFLTGHFDAAERRLRDAEAAPDLNSVRSGEIALMRSALASTPDRS